MRLTVIFSMMAILVLFQTSFSETKAASNKPLSGTITLSGAWSLYPMVVKWAEEFRKINPEVKIDVAGGGAGKGIADALNGQADLGMVSRDLNPAEVEKGAWAIPVTKDAVVPVGNVNNPVWNTLKKNGMTKEQFTRIWMDSAISNWGAIIKGAKNTLNVYTRSDACGAAETWAKYMGIGQEDLLGVGVYGDPGLAEAVLRDVNGIGYNNVNYAYDATTKKAIQGLTVVPIDVNGNGKLDEAENFYHSRETLLKAIAEGRYPSPPARNLLLVSKGKPASPIVTAFLKWIVVEGQVFVPEAGFVPLSKETLDKAVASLGK